MARKRNDLLMFDTFRLEGALFVPDLLEKIANGEHTVQREADYQLPKGIKLSDEYGRAFQIARAQWRDFSSAWAQPNADRVTCNFIREFLTDALGYSIPLPDGEEAPSPFLLPPGEPGSRLPIVIAPHTLELDDPDARFMGEGLGHRRKSACQFAQEFLNARDGFLWALVTNGRKIRLVRDNASLTRPCYLEFDLETILSDARYADFTVLWRVLQASRAGQNCAGGAACVWETWRADGQEQGTRVRTALRDGVTRALMFLGDGFLAQSGNDALRTALSDGSLTAEGYFQQLLRTVYRFLFLFTVEERGILHPEGTAPDIKRVYDEGYSFRRLRARSLRKAGFDRHRDLWEGVRVVFRGLDKGEARLGLPALGGLFAASQCRWLDAAALDNCALLSVMRDLRWTKADKALAPVDYRNIGPEELGSVYESLLELVPTLDLPARRFGFVGITDAGSTAGNTRKTTGSYYTPDCLVQELIKSALEPVIEERLGAPDPEKALLSLAVIDPACGSGHFLLAAARRIAEKLAQVRVNAGVVKPQDYRHALRDVVASCIYGTDLNPMAVELAKIALWLEGFESGRPLSFLNHHLVCGNALLGITDLKQLNAGIPADAFKALSGDDKEACKRLAAMNRAALKGRDQAGQGELFAVNADEFRVRLAALDAMPGDRPEEIAAKETAYAGLLATAHASGVACAADLFVGAFLLPKQPDAAIPTSATLFDALEGTRNDADFAAAREAAQRACESARVLHWPLAFAQIFARGGFDCVLGNPPWERIKLQEEEFFATRHPEIAEARNKAERGQRIAWLAEGRLAAHLHPDGDAGSACALEVELFRQFIQARREAEASSIFAHVKGEEGGRYPLTGVGDVNTYALFAETICQIVSAKGRAGFIVPSGIASDDSTKVFFSSLTQNRLLFSLYDFENRAGIFPAIDSRTKFSLVTIARRERARFAFFMTDPRDMSDQRRFFELTPDEFRLMSPNTLTCPVFRSQRDAELTKKIYRNSGVLLDENREGGNPWDVSFTRLFDMANDSDVFLSEYAPSLLPLYEAKMIHQFDHRWATYEASGGDDEDACRNMTGLEKRCPDIAVRPRYWVRQREVLARLADVPAAVARAYVGDDEPLLRKAVANWLALTFVGQYPLSTPRDIVAKVVGKAFADALPKEWLDEKFRISTCTPPSADELDLMRNAKDLFGAFDVVMDRRSPRWLMGWRDITNATNERTVIASVIPRSAVGHTLPLVFSGCSVSLVAAFLACLNTSVLDYVARLKVGGTHLTYGYLKQFPILSPSSFTVADLAFIVPRVLELTYTSHDLKPWAEDLGYTGEPFVFDEERRAVLRAELDAYYAKLYGLNEEELRYILDPADVAGADYPSETFRVLKDREMREYGEYRTRRLVLEAWKRLESEPVRVAASAQAVPQLRSTRAYVDRKLYCRKLVLSMLAQSEDKLPLDRLLSAWVALCDVDGLVRIIGGSADVKSWAALWPDRLTDNDSLQATLWDLLDRQAVRVTRFHVVERREEDGTAGTADVQMDARFALAGADAYATHAPRPKPIRREDYFDPGFLTKVEEGAYAAV